MFSIVGYSGRRRAFYSPRVQSRFRTSIIGIYTIFRRNLIVASVVGSRKTVSRFGNHKQAFKKIFTLYVSGDKGCWWTYPDISKLWSCVRLKCKSHIKFESFKFYQWWQEWLFHRYFKCYKMLLLWGESYFASDQFKKKFPFQDYCNSVKTIGISFTALVFMAYMRIFWKEMWLHLDAFNDLIILYFLPNHNHLQTS